MADKTTTAEDAAGALDGTELLRIVQSATSKKVALDTLLARIVAVYFDTDGALAANSDSKLATQKAVVTYVAALSATLSAAITAAVNGRAWKPSVRARTTAALAANTYANGSSGVGATLTGNSNGALAAQDGVTLAASDRVLVADESTGSHNGPYAVTQVGDGSHPYILTRVADADIAAELRQASMFIEEGTLYADTMWTCTTNAPITVGTTALAFAQTGSGNIPDGDKGDITVSSSGAAWSIDNDVVTYAKMQNVSATSRILGRKTSGSGDAEECTLSDILDFISSAAQGDMLYRGSSTWARLAAGAAKQILQANGAAAPTWVDNVWVQTISLSDLSTALATGTFLNYFDLPFDVVLTEVIATVSTASSSGLPQFNVKKNGTTVFSTNVTIDATETSSLTAATPAVISVTTGSKGDRYSADIVAAGTGTKGAQITCIFKRA